MSNINVRVVGTANVTQMSGAFGKLEAQVTALNAQLAQMVALQNGVDPSGYERMSRAAAHNSKTFRNAAASTGMFEVQQLKLNRATDDYVTKLQKQQMSFRELAKSRKVATAAYKEQLAMEQMVVRQSRSGTVHGKNMLDVTYPRQISAELDTASRRLSFFNEQLKSGAHQMVNWGKNTQWAGRQLMVGFTMPMAAFGAAAGVMAYQVDKQLTRIAKVYDTTADANNTTVKGQMMLEKELQQLREDGVATAIKAAKEYGAAGTDTLEVQAELAATGQSGIELQRSTAEVMRIARLGEIEHQDAINATISLQSVFRMSNEELTKSFNYMNAVENATSLATEDFAKAIPIAAAPVKAFGGDIQELGVLLTAMKERGIEATQGANAIKAAMQRLGRPSAQVQEEWQALTGTDITKLFDESTSLIDLFTRIKDATANLDNKEQIKAFAGLFGTYQVTRMSALVKGMEDLENGIGQVSTASELAAGSSKQWADTAEREMQRYRESISGQFDTAKNEFMLQLSTLGEPFVAVATVILKGLNKVISAFNDLPNVAKIAIAAALGIAALAGPVIMLTGLFANLMGNGIKAFAAVAGWITRFTGSLKISTTEQRAAAMAAETASTTMVKEASAVEMLTMQLRKLELAQIAANRARMQSAAAGLQANGMSAGLAAATVLGSDLRTQGAANSAAYLTTTTDKIADNSEKTKRNWKSAAGHVGFAAGMASLMLMDSEGIVGNVAQMVFYASLLGPLMLPLSGLLVKGFTKAKAGALAVSGAMGKARTNAVGFGKTVATSATPMRTLARSAGSVLLSIGRFIGPLGLAAGAIGGILWAVNKWREHNEEILEQARAEERAIVSRTNLLSEALDIQIRKQKQLNTLSATDISARDNGPSTFELSKTLVETEEGKALVSGYKEADATEQATIAAQKYSQVLSAVGGNSTKARKYVEALFLAAGDGALEAQAKATELYMQLGADIDSGEQVELWKSLINDNNFESDLELAKTQGTALGKEIANSMAQATQGPERRQAFKPMADAFTQTMEDAYGALDSRTQGLFAEIGANSSEEISKVIADYQALRDGTMSEADFKTEYGITETILTDSDKYLSIMEASEVAAGALGSRLTAVRTTEEAMVKELATQLGITQDISTMTELRATKEWQLQTASKKQAEALYEQRAAMLDTLGTLSGIFGVSEGLTYEMKLQELNQWRVAQGLEETGILADGFKAATVDINGNILRSAESTFKLGGETQRVGGLLYGQGTMIKKNTGKWREQHAVVRALANVMQSLTSQDFLSAAQSGMQGVQEDIADDMRDAFDDRMENALEQRQNMWDSRADALSDEMERRSEAMDREHERQTDALDAKWERRTDAAEEYWDRRIELVDKAIEREQKAEELRQKMFDAEMARIDRLNDMANTNIDFNVALNEGNFDEAAKIRNDAQADAVATALERAASAGARGSERRVNRLENRKEGLDEAREAAMEQLEAQAEAEKAALAASQERQKAHLAAVTEMREEALAEQAEADMETQREIWESRKESLEEQLELFLSYIARNEKDLKRHMDNVGLSYHKFGRDVLKPKGEEWSKYFGERLQHHIRAAGLKLASDKMWTKLGEGSVRGLLKGMGFTSMGEFRTFIQTGKFGGGRGALGNGARGNATGNTGGTNQNYGDNMGGTTKYNHAGGEVGKSNTSNRRGVARTTRGLHPTEEVITAQKGEYIVNRKDAQANKETLEAINSGANTGFDTMETRGGIGGAGAPGVAGLMAATLNKAMARGIGVAMNNAYAKKMSQIRRRQKARGFGVADPGTYGDRYFSAQQLKNAKTIASVGKNMGMSERDIQIGIMTAITESGLVNVKYGDRDSLGLFQQRPSMGWGTPAQVTDPQYAAAKFFSSLKGVVNRGAMSPWMAAQSVQRSFDETGSNYRVYWDEANAIWKAMESSGGRGGGRQYASGPGGWAKPSKPGLGWTNTHDYRAPIGTPIYAVSDGTIVESRAITSGGSPGNGLYSTPYRSYGETIAMRTQSGDIFRYAHLNPGSRTGTGQVKGGTMIGRTGNTGNSSGPHLHMDVNGNYDAQGWLARHGVSLSKGAANIKWDNTIANLHKGEAVLTEDLNKKFHQGVENFANGGDNHYTLIVNGNNASADEIAEKVLVKIKRLESRKPRSRRV